jgi:2-polyprenyl-3-methyl-5-hydroxy-6-metoxy-1,4-benzoquinol methylase
VTHMGTNACRICGNGDGNVLHLVREMMFGLRDEFRYIECGSCGCLQIEEHPQDLARYYPSEYYSFDRVKTGLLRDYFQSVRVRHGVGRRTPLGWVLTRFLGESVVVPWVKVLKIKASDSILDVGSGQGRHLLELRAAGFRNVIGVDAYIDSPITYANGVRILKKGLEGVTEQYDLVMLHHSFEHMADPAAELRHIERVVKPGGYALIRTPIVPCYAWKTYGVHWVQLDAPRHLFVHSLRSINVLLAKTSLRLMKVEYDSTALQFVGSEQYRENIPLWGAESYYVRPDASRFKTEDMRRFRALAGELNARGDGDSVCLYLQKPFDSIT